MLELLAALGRDRAVLVGHDWGSAVVWNIASHHWMAQEQLIAVNGALTQWLATQVPDVWPMPATRLRPPINAGFGHRPTPQTSRRPPIVPTNLSDVLARCAAAR
jgi:pimeloyl-ACP methyl ester carboxylesterase